MGKAAGYGIFLPVFNSISFKWAQWFSTSCKPCRDVKMVNLGKEIENEKKWNEKKLGPCMNIFLNFDPNTTLDLFHPKQWVQKGSNIKEIETWKVEKWPIGYETAKWLKNDQCWERTQFYGPRTNRMQIKSFGNSKQRNSNHLSFVLKKKRETTGTTNQY